MVMWFHAVASPGWPGEGSGEVSPVVNADLAEDGLDVVAHGVRRQEKACGDVIAGAVLDDQGGDVALAGGEIPGSLEPRR